MLERAKGVRTQGCSEAAAAVPWNRCREKEGLSGVSVMYQRDLDPDGGMGVCGGRISDRIFSRLEPGEGTNNGAFFLDEMAKGAGVLERGRSGRGEWQRGPCRFSLLISVSEYYFQVCPFSITTICRISLSQTL